MKAIDHLGVDIEAAVVDSQIEEFLTACVARIQDKDDLVSFFRRFALYNQPFPGGVASLAGDLHLRSEMFRDRDDPLGDNEDRSSIIASNIIFAAEDEFAAPDRRVRVTHRLMAQEMVRIAVEHAGWDVERFNTTFEEDLSHVDMTERLKRGYRVGGAETDVDLFRAIGFHLGSERLADIEFTVLHDHLVDAFSSFVQLAKTDITPGGYSTWRWIELHATSGSDASEASVEVDHFAFSLMGAKQALTYYVGEKLDGQQAYRAILDGFHEFIDYQQIMFSWLKET